jgi:Ca2+-dependent lipid-binding protein
MAIVHCVVIFRLGADVDVSIEDLNLSGRAQIVFEMDHMIPFPHMKSVAVTFLEK